MKIKVKESLTSKRLQYEKSFLDYINDILPTIFLGLIGMYLLIQLALNFNEGFKTIGLIILFLLLTTLLLVSTIKEYLALDRLAGLKIARRKAENRELIIGIVDKLKWRILADNTDHFIFRNPWRLFNGGENVTIIYRDDWILFNSTSYPINDVTRTTLTFGANQRNLNKFKRCLTEVLKSGTSHNKMHNQWRGSV
jgi:hypothetical protein